MASPVSNGRFVVVIDNNILRAYDVQSGKKAYERRLGQLKTVAASPLMIDDKLLVVDETGNAILLNALDEFSPIGGGKLDDTFWATPSIANNSIYLRGIDGLYCIRSN